MTVWDSHVLHLLTITLYYFAAYETLKAHNFSAVIGSHDDVVAMVTDKLGIPYMVTDFGSYGNDYSNVFYMLPSWENIIECLLSLVDAFSWQNVGVLYESGVGMTLAFIYLYNLGSK